MSRLSLGDIDELARLRGMILKRSALIDELLERGREQFKGKSDEAFGGDIESVRRRSTLAELLDDITEAARCGFAQSSREDGERRPHCGDEVEGSSHIRDEVSRRELVFL